MEFLKMSGNEDKVYFELTDFPEFRKAHLDDEFNSWNESLRAAGYLSAHGDWYNLYMSAEDFMFFKLKWG